MPLLDNYDLSSEQKKTVFSEDNTLLIACPGSGKTRTIVYKLAYELTRKCGEKRKIIAITYTNIAADEIKERLHLLGIDTTGLWIGTIHAFCLEWILRPYSSCLNELRYGFKIFNSHDSEELLTSLCEGSGIKYWDCNFIATSTGYKLLNTLESKRLSINRVLERYHCTLTANGHIDFEGILLYSFRILEENASVCKILSNIFSWVLIDEYQDTKEIQYQIIAKILSVGGGGTSLFIVGDPNQSIFGTLGGFAMDKSEIERLCGLVMIERSLSGNYRSSRDIVDYYCRYSLVPHAITALGADKDYNSAITYDRATDLDGLHDEIARLILSSIAKGISPEEICVLGPRWLHLGTVARALMARLPDYSFNGPGMTPISRDIDNFWYKIARIALTEPSPDSYVRRLSWGSEVLQELGQLGVNVSMLDSKSFLKLCNSICCTEMDGLLYLESFFNELCLAMELDKSAYSSLNEHYNSFFASARKRITKLISEGSPSIGGIASFRKVFKQRSGITVSTAHGAKGTEYDTVIAFGLLEGIIPHFADPDGSNSAKKLLYVIASRARKNLHLISERGRRNPVPTFQIGSCEPVF